MRDKSSELPKIHYLYRFANLADNELQGNNSWGSAYVLLNVLTCAGRRIQGANHPGI